MIKTSEEPLRFLQRQIEARLSSQLGAPVSFESFNVSLLGGSIEARGLVVASGTGGPALLYVPRIHAEVAYARMLSGEINVKSLTIERPVVSLELLANGGVNAAVPKRAAKTPQPPSEESEGAAWKFAAEKVLVVDGEIHLRSRHPADANYHLAATKLLADLKRMRDGYTLTCLIESLRREDHLAVPLSLSAAAVFTGAPDLARLATVPFTASAQIGDAFSARITGPSLVGESISVSAKVSLSPDALKEGVPPSLMPNNIRKVTARLVTLAVDAVFTLPNSVKISQFAFTASDVDVPLSDIIPSRVSTPFP